LLTRLVGDRASAEPAAVAELARRCAYLPLGLRLVAEFVANRPQVTLAEHLADLDAADTLDQLDAGGDEETSLRAVFSWSYLRLSPEAARAFRLLGAHPGREYDVYAVAALLDSSLSGARALVRNLKRAHLLEEPTAGRYTMHDLLHVYAVELASQEADRQTALGRLLDHYVWCATTAHHVLYTYSQHWLPRLADIPATPAPVLETSEQALTWFDLERPNLVAAVTRVSSAEHVIGIASATDHYLHVGAHFSESETVLQAAIGAARSCGDRLSEGRAHAELGRVFAQTARYERADEHLTQAAAVANETADRTTAYRALLGLAKVRFDLGQYEQAVTIVTRALTLAYQIGDPWFEGTTLGNLGLCFEALNEYDKALDLYRRASAVHREAGNRNGEGSVLESLGSTYLRLGRPAEAVHYQAQALRVVRESGHVENEISALNGLGLALAASRRDAEAQERHEVALQLARQVGARIEEMRALDGLGDLALANDRPDEARGRWSDALQVAVDIGVPQAEQVRAKLAALDEAEHGAREAG